METLQPVDVINVAGLLIDHGMERMERHLHDGLHPRWLKTIMPAGPSSVLESPEESICRTIDFVNESVRELEDRFGESRVVLVGASNGGFTALLAACRLKFEKIFRAVAIEAPLNPDVTVSPPALMPHLHACVRHYSERPQYAAEARDAMEKFGTGKVLAIVNRHDDVVSPEAQKPVGDFELIELDNGDAALINMRLSRSRGSVVVLPENIVGTAKGWRKVLPQGYINHLSWSPEKYALIGGIIASDIAIGEKPQTKAA